MRLIEPLGLLHGPAAREAMAAGLALPLAGGPPAFTPATFTPVAFTLARLIPDGAIVPVRDIPPDWHAEQTRLTTAPPPWAGLSTNRPLVMGILNITPDSFSDGGRHFDSATAIAAGHAMADAGADILDIGGESTRPGAAPVTPDQEQARILPVIAALAGTRPISVDTRHAATMAAALDAGAAIVNDVSGLTHAPQAAALVSRRRCPVILMHMRGTPADMARHALYTDAAVDVTHELAARAQTAIAAGIASAAIALDPGIGFAKNASQNRELLLRLPLLANLGHRLVLGVSRKRSIGEWSGEADPANRLPGSLAAGLAGLLGGAAILRVHDVAETIQAVRVWHGLFGTEV